MKFNVQVGFNGNVQHFLLVEHNTRRLEVIVSSVPCSKGDILGYKNCIHR